MGALNLILGRSGSGKTREIFSRVKSTLDCGRRTILIVPEHFTYESELRLSRFLGNGLMNVGVYSFSVLADRILRQSGADSSYLSRQGRRMVVRRCLEEMGDTLTAYKNVYRRPGFVKECDEFFTQCKNFNIAPEELYEKAQEIKDGLLKSKLSELCSVSMAVNRHMESRFLDSADKINAFIDSIGSSFLRGLDVYIDGFDVLTEQHYGILRAFLRECAGVTITLKHPEKGDRDYALFEPQLRIMRNLIKIANEEGAEVRKTGLAKKSGARAKELEHLEKELYAFPKNAFSGKADGISIFEASGRKAEVSAMTARLIKQVKGGMRYRDIAVIVPDMEGYSTLISQAFSQENIPLYTDVKRALVGHPLVELVSSALRAIADGFRQQDIFALIKTSLCGLTPAQCEILENYMLCYGQTGSTLLSPFTQGENPAEMEELRRIVMLPLLELRERLKNETVSKKVEAVAAYITALKADMAINGWVGELERQGRFTLMEENAQVWNILMELFDQLHTILGETRLSNRSFLMVMEEGFEAYEVGTIPATTDQVTLCTPQMAVARRLKSLFVLGCSEGQFPAVRRDDGFIDDSDLRAIGELGFTPWDDSEYRAQNDRLEIYSALSNVSETLWLSYPVSVGGSALPPSRLIDYIKELFPSVEEITDIGAEESAQTPAAGVYHLASALRQEIDNGAPPKGLEALYGWYCGKPEYRRKIELIDSALYFSPVPKSVGELYAKKVYGSMERVSASEIEDFNACGFRHFANYGLRVEERRERRERSVDMGNFYHAVLERFIGGMIEDGDWNALTREECMARLDAIIPEILKSHNNGILLSGARFRIASRQMIRNAKTTAWVIAKQYKSGDFRPFATEATFGKGGIFPPLVIQTGDGRRFEVRGKIDRVDYCAGDPPLIRVVDYKSGSHNVSYSEIYEGVSLQLPLYIAAVKAADKTSRIAGMYLQHVKEPLLDIPAGKTEDEIESILMKQLKLNGITVNTLEVARASNHVDRIHNKNATAVKSSNLVDEAFIGKVMEYAVKKAADTYRSISSGAIEANPVIAGNTACKMCDFKSVCLFDTKLNNCSYRTLKKMQNTEQDFLSVIGEEDG